MMRNRRLIDLHFFKEYCKKCLKFFSKLPKSIVANNIVNAVNQEHVYMHKSIINDCSVCFLSVSDWAFAAPPKPANARCIKIRDRLSHAPILLAHMNANMYTAMTHTHRPMLVAALAGTAKPFREADG
jgi:hypothetical protein